MDERRGVGRLTGDDVALTDYDGSPVVLGYVCGSTSFTNAPKELMASAGMEATQIRFERFGPTG